MASYYKQGQRKAPGFFLTVDREEEDEEATRILFTTKPKWKPLLDNSSRKTELNDVFKAINKERLLKANKFKLNFPIQKTFSKQTCNRQKTKQEKKKPQKNPILLEG